jgi:hypothetical protein
MIKKTLKGLAAIAAVATWINAAPILESIESYQMWGHFTPYATEKHQTITDSNGNWKRMVEHDWDGDGHYDELMIYHGHKDSMFIHCKRAAIGSEPVAKEK